MADKEYYQRQLAKLESHDIYNMSIKLWDGNGDHTNTMDLTNECIEVLETWLKIQKERNNEKIK